MGKRSLILFALLLVFWLVISGGLDWQHLLMGLVLVLGTVWLWHDLGPRLPQILIPKTLFGLGRILVLMPLYIVQANLAVIKTLLFSSPQVSPVFVFMQPTIKTNWGRILLATCITLTPGTVTVDVDPETGRFIVHALTEETAVGLLYWRIIHEIEALEDPERRRAEHVVASGGAHGLDSANSVSGDYGTNGN